LTKSSPLRREEGGMKGREMLVEITGRPEGFSEISLAGEVVFSRRREENLGRKRQADLWTGAEKVLWTEKGRKAEVRKHGRGTDRSKTRTSITRISGHGCQRQKGRCQMILGFPTLHRRES